MKLNPPTVLLHRSFLDAVIDPLHDRHPEAATTYLALVDEFEADRRLLTALSTDLADLGAEVRRGLLAPVAALHPARQHRSAARTMVDLADDPAFSLVLLLMQREKITTVAAFDDRFERFELELLPESQPSI